jgi:hypothetical protein
MLDQADPRTVGTGRGPTPKSRTPCDLYVCQISDAVMCHPLHIEAERLRADPDLRRNLSQGPDLRIRRLAALTPDGRLRASCGLPADRLLRSRLMQYSSHRDDHTALQSAAHRQRTIFLARPPRSDRLSRAVLMLKESRRSTTGA